MIGAGSDPGHGRDRRDDPVERRDVDDVLEGIDVPGSGARADRRREAVKAAYEYLREEGTATKSDFISELYREFPAGYSSEGGWWNCVQPALRDVARELETVDPPGEGEHNWTWVGEKTGQT